MCDKILSKKYSTQNIDKTIEFTANSINIPYKGPTTGLETSLRSTKDQKVILKGKISFEVEADICDRENLLETSAILMIEKLTAGPYETVGSEIEFKDLYFHFKNLKLFLKTKFYFNPLSICREEESVSTKGIGSLMFMIDEEKGIEFEKYFVSNGTDETKVNELFYDLEPQFKIYNSTFGIFFDSIAEKLEFNKDFGTPVKNEFIKILCEYNKENIPTQAYYEKVEHLKQMNIYSVIKGGDFSKMGMFNPEI